MSKSAKNSYEPPFNITPLVLNLVAEITEKIGVLSVGEASPKLRKENRIRTIQASLAIENNTLTVEQVSDIIDGKKVIGLKSEIDAVKNAVSCYNLIGKLDPYNEKDLLRAHGVMMNGLVDGAGAFRTRGVGVFKGEEAVHIGPPPQMVPELVGKLLVWLGKTEIHPLIASSVFHYEFEFIHPFADGNGRMGRFWQTLILSKWKPILGNLPVETVIKENQQEYYDSLRASDCGGDSTAFVEFMLKALIKTINMLSSSNLSDQVADQVSDQVRKLLDVLKNGEMSAKEIMSELRLKHRATFRNNYLKPALEAKLVGMKDPGSPNSPAQKYRLL